jgi:ankyrin repeat protein
MTFISYLTPFLDATTCTSARPEVSARDQAEEIQKMIEQGADPTAVNGLGQSALHVACLWGHHKCVEVLIKAGAKVRARLRTTDAHSCILQNL